MLFEKKSEKIQLLNSTSIKISCIFILATDIRIQKSKKRKKMKKNKEKILIKGLKKWRIC